MSAPTPRPGRRPVRRPVRRLQLLAGGAALCGVLTTAVVATPAGADAPAGPSAPVTDPEVRRDLAGVQADLDALVAEDGLPGVLAAVRGADGRVHDLTAGVGDLATGEPVPVDGRVRIASNTKTFTAVVVLQLVAEGRISLDDPVETHLPGLLRGIGVDGGAITVRQLLQHTSGLPEYTDVVAAELPAPGQHRFYEPHELVQTALAKPATSAPGQGWSYSNTNYVVAGLLVQRVTGRPVGEEITRRIVEPLGLADTYWPGEGEVGIRGEHPRGYSAAAPGQPWVDTTEFDTSAAHAAGALVSTPRDLMTFTEALLDGELLPPDLLAQMQDTVSAPGISVRPGDAGYGLGLQTFPLSCGGVAWTHGGDVFGYETRHAVTEDGRAAVVAVTGLPTSLDTVRHVEEAVDGALCD